MNVSIGGIAKTVEITSFDKLGDVKVCMLTTTADGSVGFQQLNQEVIDTIYASFPVDTAKGDIASFEDGADNVPVRKLTLNLVPYQGGSGDPAPDNVRPIYPANGRNLLQNNESSRTTSGITFTVLDDGSVSASGTATADVGFAIAVDTTKVYGDLYFVGLYGQTNDLTANVYMWDITANARCKQWNGTSNAANSYDGTLKQVKIIQGNTVSLVTRIMNGKTVNNFVFKPMICPAEITDPAYVPYNALGITRTGKNLYIGSPSFDGFKNIATYTTTGETYNGHEVIYKASAWGGASKPIQVKGGCTYTFSAMAKVSVANKPVFLHGSSGLIASKTIATANTWTRVSGTYLATKDGTEEFRIESESNSYTVYLSEYQLEVGSTATEYEPYTADRYYIDSSTPIYGGTLEVETGVLTVTHEYVDVGTYGISGTAVSSNVRRWYTTPNTAFKTVAYCNSLKTSDSYVYSSLDYASISTDNRIVVTPTWGQAISTVADFNTAVANNPITVVIEIATPQTYQLTPTQVKTLLGYNNIWTDSGTVEVQYRANIGLYIQKIIGSSEDDMIANQNIAANQYFFVGEELYYSTSAISAGQTIVVGTNCIKTTLADALNALNS